MCQVISWLLNPWLSSVPVCKISPSHLCNSLFFYVNVNLFAYVITLSSCEPINISEALFWYEFIRTKILKTFVLDISNDCLWHLMLSCYFKSLVLCRESGQGCEERNFIGMWLRSRSLKMCSGIQRVKTHWLGATCEAHASCLHCYVLFCMLNCIFVSSPVTCGVHQVQWVFKYWVTAVLFKFCTNTVNISSARISHTVRVLNQHPVWKSPNDQHRSSHQTERNVD